MDKTIINALNWRYAVQKFNPSQKVDAKDIGTILEAARLAPSSFGTEPWQFIVVENKKIRKRLFEEASPQAKVIDAPYFVVIASRKGKKEQIASERVDRTAKITGAPKEKLEGLHSTIAGFVGSLSDSDFYIWAENQTYIALGVMVEAAALLGIDSGPMTGFDHDKFDEILGLSQKNLRSVSAIAFGYRGDDPAAERPKVRRSFDDVVTRIS